MLDYFLRGAKYLDTTIQYAVFRFHEQNTVIIRYNIILPKNVLLSNRVYEFIKNVMHINWHDNATIVHLI